MLCRVERDRETETIEPLWLEYEDPRERRKGKETVKRKKE
jgi:hypothetical protein